MQTSPALAHTKRSLDSMPLSQAFQRPNQLPSYRKQELAESRALAARMQDNSRSMRLEMMLRKQRANDLNTLLNEDRKRPAKLQYLAVTQLPGQRFQILIRSEAKPLTTQVFATLQYCAEAAAALEQTFAMDGLLNRPFGEAIEQSEAIIQAYVWREWVMLRMTEMIA